MDNSAYFLEIPIDEIKPSSLNPRTVFDQEKINELAESFSERGIIQPIIVYPDNSRYRIICGERRWRAARLANILKIPAIVHPPISDEIAVSMALIENMHRQNVDVVSEAAAIRSLVDSYAWKVTKVSKELGVSNTYIHKRLLITKHADILAKLTQKQISFSEAYELATLNDFAAREWFLERLKSKEFYNFKEFGDAISRYRKISHFVVDSESLSQPLNREKEIEFEVKDLRYCDSKCDHYLRLTWDEKQHFKIPSDEPGWSEFCTAINSACYVKKREAKEKFYGTLKSIKDKLPIPDDGWESMLWFQYGNKMCKICDSLIDAFDLENIGSVKESGVFAYCIESNTECYEKRCLAYEERRINREDERLAEKERRKAQILKSIKGDASSSPKTSWAYMTKRECVYLIMQFLIYAGSQERIKDFAKAFSFDRNMPSKYSAQVIYIKNKLMDTVKEKELIDLLFAEAAASAAFVQKEIEPKKFNRGKQQEFPIIFRN